MTAILQAPNCRQIRNQHHPHTVAASHLFCALLIFFFIFLFCIRVPTPSLLTDSSPSDDQPSNESNQTSEEGPVCKIKRVEDPDELDRVIKNLVQEYLGHKSVEVGILCDSHIWSLAMRASLYPLSVSTPVGSNISCYGLLWLDQHSCLHPWNSCFHVRSSEWPSTSFSIIRTSY